MWREAAARDGPQLRCGGWFLMFLTMVGHAPDSAAVYMQCACVLWKEKSCVSCPGLLGTSTGSRMASCRTRSCSLEKILFWSEASCDGRSAGL